MSERPQTHGTESARGALSRRSLLRAGGGAASLGLVAALAACGGSQPAAPTAAPTATTAAGAGAPTISGGLATPPASPAATPAAATPAAAASPVASPAASPVEGATPPAGSATAGGTPAAQAAPDPKRAAAFMALSAALVGGGRLDPDRGTQFLQLADADPAKRAALDALLAAPPTAPAPAASPTVRYDWGDAAATPGPAATPPGPDIAADILAFWYEGIFANEAVPQRDTFWFSLSSWQAVHYTAAMSICKSFGSWADAPTTV